jgi:hypothetical protein
VLLAQLDNEVLLVLRANMAQLVLVVPVLVEQLDLPVPRVQLVLEDLQELPA